MPEYHLGVSSYYHDSAAALVQNDQIIAAAQQERFSRNRHDNGFPADAVRYCLKEAGITLSDLASVSYYEDPKLKFARTLSSFASAGPTAVGTFSRIAPEWITWKRRAASRVDEELDRLQLGRAPRAMPSLHHRSHAASAFYPSPFEHAVVLCVDGVGEWHTTSVWHGTGAALDLVNSISYPHSLGLLYSAFTYYCGFKVDSGEYKLMGLAPYGEPKFAKLIRDELINLRADGSFTLNLDYFTFLQGERMVGERFAKLFGQDPRTPETPLGQFHCDIAASIQEVTDEAVFGLAKAARAMTGERNLCLAGGVALNCVSNGKLSRSGPFSRLWIQPAAGDAGCALGAALDTAIARLGRRSVPGAGANGDGADKMNGAHLGPSFSDEEIGAFLDSHGYSYTRLTESELYETVAAQLADGAVVGWFQDRMEFGPRALGARSIIGDARNTAMQKTMNLKIKFRESFRPFAPSVLAEDASEYFDVRQESPYMLIVSPVVEGIRTKANTQRTLDSINEVRSKLPAVTHVDFSARVQTVTEEANPRFTRLLRSFKVKTGCPVLVNTSFNVRGEPIVCTPQDAYLCFMRTRMDVLVLGSCVLHKNEQPPLVEDEDWREAIPLD